MAEGGNWEGDSVASTSKKKKGGKLTKVGKILKRLWPGTSSKNDGQNTGTTTEKQSGIESSTSMECEPAEEEREQCQSRERGIGDVVHAPGTESSDKIHHDRDSSNKESSSPLQGADINSAISAFLSNCDDHQLLQLTRFYRDRLEQAIEECVEGVSLMVMSTDHFTGQECHRVTELAETGKQAAGSKLLLNLVMEKDSGAQRLMWESLVKIHHTLPKLSRILKEILAQGKDQLAYMDTVGQGLSEVPTHLKGK
ncbi:uncharacterized protein LOC116970374 isoform X1 [Amblyraja radiata]|uniref:uncharacterized protein LOC116970374 isoform X1 n=1 Tax=Amblyraja radiata TaxID=386614 RepID=UPI001403AB49|nr:uncharacterized protein LOC116970374 isoform X1 [Amblyraja radiata]